MFKHSLRLARKTQPFRTNNENINAILCLMFYYANQIEHMICDHSTTKPQKITIRPQFSYIFLALSTFEPNVLRLSSFNSSQWFTQWRLVRSGQCPTKSFPLHIFSDYIAFYQYIDCGSLTDVNKTHRITSAGCVNGFNIFA